jgi:hypothetical protein
VFFSKSAVFFSIVAFVVGAFSVLLGTGAALGFLDELARARNVSVSPQQVIAWGIYVIFASVALGTLAEISLSLHLLDDSEIG